MKYDDIQIVIKEATPPPQDYVNHPGEVFEEFWTQEVDTFGQMHDLDNISDEELAEIVNTTLKALAANLKQESFGGMEISKDDIAGLKKIRNKFAGLTTGSALATLASLGGSIYSIITGNTIGNIASSAVWGASVVALIKSAKHLYISNKALRDAIFVYMTENSELKAVPYEEPPRDEDCIDINEIDEK